MSAANDDNEADSLSNIPFRWMLREAEHCGLQIDAAGLVLNKAIADLPIIEETNIIPVHLRELLQREVSGDLIEHDAYEEVRNMVEQYLPPGVLHEIIQMAAAYDSIQDDELGDGARLSETSSVSQRRASPPSGCRSSSSSSRPGTTMPLRKVDLPIPGSRCRRVIMC